MADNRRREPLRGALIAIVAAAIAAGGTLAGNYLASVNARDQLAAQFEPEDEVRQDDLRRDVYQRFIAVASKYQIDLRHGASASAQEEAAINRDIINDITQIQTEWSEVQLVGTAKAAGLAKAVRESLDKLAINSDLTPEALDRRVQQTLPKLQLFVDTAREELNA
jgi:hypothetical protein